FVRGNNALDFVNHITINDASLLSNGRVQYSAMCYEDGGIVDDLLVYKINENEFMLVVNASNLEKDFAWLNKNNSFGVELVNESDDYSLLAVQGTNSKEILQKICDKQLDLEYYHFFTAKVAGVDTILSRTGYTGELGYELYFKGSETVAENIWNAIFDAGKDFGIQPVGLAARDSLRLEMGFCLYGNDIDQTTNPIEAGLGWITKLKKPSFIGKDFLAAVKENGPTKKLAAMISNEKTFPRQGYNLTIDGRKAGYITSGTVSPMLDKAIALGYVDTEFAKEGNKINFLIRGKEVEAQITKLPFVKK
ncbi:MAG: glycine cleavage system aminomethyltransferase GcvT, partial [Bacteroidota bacterium]